MHSLLPQLSDLIIEHRLFRYVNLQFSGRQFVSDRHHCMTITYIKTKTESIKTLPEYRQYWSDTPMTSIFSFSVFSFCAAFPLLPA